MFLLFAAPGGWLGFGLVMMGVSWILFGLWIVYEHRAFAIVVAAVPAVATIFYLYADDFDVSGL